MDDAKTELDHLFTGSCITSASFTHTDSMASHCRNWQHSDELRLSMAYGWEVTDWFSFQRKYNIFYNMLYTENKEYQLGSNYEAHTTVAFQITITYTLICSNILFFISICTSVDWIHSWFWSPPTTHNLDSIIILYFHKTFYVYYSTGWPHSRLLCHSTLDSLVNHTTVVPFNLY